VNLKVKAASEGAGAVVAILSENSRIK